MAVHFDALIAIDGLYVRRCRSRSITTAGSCGPPAKRIDVPSRSGHCMPQGRRSREGVRHPARHSTAAELWSARACRRFSSLVYARRRRDRRHREYSTCAQRRDDRTEVLAGSPRCRRGGTPVVRSEVIGVARRDRCRVTDVEVLDGVIALVVSTRMPQQCRIRAEERGARVRLESVNRLGSASS